MVGNSMTSAPSLAELITQRAGLFAGAGDDNPLARERPLVVPAQLFA
jgi:hypothetical protein